MRGRVGSIVPTFLKKKKSEEQQLADTLVPFKVQMVEYLKANKAYGGTQRRATVLQAQFAKKPNDRDQHAEALLQTIPKSLKPSNIRFLGNNNFNMAVQTKTAAVIVQATTLDNNQMNSMNKLYASGHASFLSVNYAEPSLLPSDNPYRSSYRKHAGVNPNSTVDGFKTNHIVSCVEHFPMSFNDKVDAAHKTNSEQVYAETANIAGQLSNILTTLNKQGLVWTDLKPGNILSRADGSLAVADFKGFYDIHSVFMSQNEEGVSCAWNGNYTPAFISKDALEHVGQYRKDPKQDLTPGELSQKARDHFFQAWQKENSYQVGVLLYSAVTGLTKDEDLIAEKIGKVKFDFDLPVFQTAQGKEYAKVIQSMTHEDPNKRISHSEAAESLQRMSKHNTTTEAQPQESTSRMMAKMGGSADLGAKKPMEPKRAEKVEAEAPKKTVKKVLTDSKNTTAPVAAETKKLNKKSLKQIDNPKDSVDENIHVPK